MHISGSNAGYTMFWGSVKSTGYPLHSPVSPSLPLPSVTVTFHFNWTLPCGCSSAHWYWLWIYWCHLYRTLPHLWKNIYETKSWLAVCWRNNRQRISHSGWSAGVRPWARHKCKGHSNPSWRTFQTLLRPTGNAATSCLVLVPGSLTSCSRIRFFSSGVRAYLDLPPSSVISVTNPIPADRR